MPGRKRPEGWLLPQRSLGYPYEATDDAVREYWRLREAELWATFERIRGTQRDSAVLGGQNENLLAAFLESTLQGRRIVRRSSIVDSSGGRSGEVDIAVCNEDQPLIGPPSDADLPLLIVEGVDAAIQVKARLTSREIGRIRENCLSVKGLHKLRTNDDDHRDVGDGPAGHFLDQVPYLVFCYDADLTAATATARLNAALKDVHPAYRPDAVFVLNKYSLINIRDHQWSVEEPFDITGFSDEHSSDLVLARFMYCLFTFPPRVRRRWHPIAGYWRT